MELSCYSFDVMHRKGELNVPADTFSRIYCSMMSTESLVRLHQGLCHPGITRMNAFVKSRNFLSFMLFISDQKHITFSSYIGQQRISTNSIYYILFFGPVFFHFIQTKVLRAQVTGAKNDQNQLISSL